MLLPHGQKRGIAERDDALPALHHIHIRRERAARRRQRHRSNVNVPLVSTKRKKIHKYTAQ